MTVPDGCPHRITKYKSFLSESIQVTTDFGTKVGEDCEKKLEEKIPWKKIY